MATVESILRTDHKAVDKRDELHTVLGWLTGDSDKVPVVLDGARAIGIVNERALMSRRVDPKAHIEGYTLTTRAVGKAADASAAAARMAEFRAAYLPVEDERERCAGYVTALDVARLAEQEWGAAREMAMPVRALREDQTMGDALHLFAQEYVHALPVTNGGGKVTGVLPRRAVLAMEINASSRGRRDAGGERLHMLKDAVSGFMEETPVTIPPSMSYSDVLDTLEESGYAIVQEKGGAMLGMVTPETMMRIIK